jgi:uncharacterized protein
MDATPQDWSCLVREQRIIVCGAVERCRSPASQPRTALGASPADVSSVPTYIARDWSLPDGQARVEVLPVASARNRAGLHQFVAAVTHMAPDAGGTAVTVVATSDTIVSAFRSAAVAAVLAIAVILLVAFRRLLDATSVLAALLLSAALLLGVGVSFYIYFVMNWRAGRRELLASATARAVAFSAPTTGTAFGSLALSGHPGTASMGALLLISLGCALVASLVFVPALLAAMAQVQGQGYERSPTRRLSQFRQEMLGPR